MQRTKMPPTPQNNEISFGELNRNFQTHLAHDSQYKERISNEISLIKENHLAHIEVDMSKMQTNIDWLLKYHWIIATASIGGLIASLMNLLK